MDQGAISEVGEPDPARGTRIPVFLAGATIAVLLLGALLLWRAGFRVNDVALSSAPKPVTVVRAREAPFRASRLYVGTLMPWVQASVGPQFVSAYVQSVVVRPGAVVKRGQVLATLDCRNASAASRAIASEAKALESRQRALAVETTRTQGLLGGGFVSKNEIERKVAENESQEAQIDAQKASAVQRTLAVDDCVLRAPFDGEVARRNADPGSFAKPGTSMIDIVDRSVVRMVADAPENDFDAVAPGTPVDIVVVATGKHLAGTITRRSPAADPDSRTITFEIDLPDPTRVIPAWTTGEVHLEAGEPMKALAFPASAASVRGGKATFFSVDRDLARAHTVRLFGEADGDLFVEPTLGNGAEIVTEGRTMLKDGDQVHAVLRPSVSQ